MRTYLMENVLPTLTKGLQEVAQVLPSLKATRYKIYIRGLYRAFGSLAANVRAESHANQSSSDVLPTLSQGLQEVAQVPRA